MDGIAKYLVIAVVGIAVGAVAVYLMASPGPKPVPAPICANILPAGDDSNGYSFYATDGNGDYALGVLHFYPNGYRHNAAVLVDSGNNPSTDPVTLFDIAVPGGCTGGNSATITLTQNGVPAASLQFTQPAGDPNATFGITFTAINNGGSQQQNPITGGAIAAGNGSGLPQSPMAGNAYLINSQQPSQ